MKHKIVKDGLVAMWSSDTWTSGTSWVDSIGNKTITFSNEPESKTDDGIELTTSITYVSESLSDLSLTQPCTFEWIGRIDGLIDATSSAHVFGLGSSVGSWFGGINAYCKASPNGFQIDLETSGSIQSGISTPSIEYHVIITIADNTTTLYVNSTTASGTSDRSAGYASKNYIYNNEGTGRYYGSVSRIALWNKCLSSEEITSLFEDANHYYGLYYLPEIPEVENYPYIMICKDDTYGYYDAFYSSERFYSDLASNTIKRGSDSSSALKWYRISIDNPTEWKYYQDYTSNIPISSVLKIVWCNDDILEYSSTSPNIYLKGITPGTKAYDYLAYNSIESLFQTGIGLTNRIYNIAHDDSTYTISSVPSWIKFNNISATSIQASGNSFLGINGSSEHIKFNRRDTKMCYLWTEEGRLWNYYDFYRIRWRGYSVYNTTSSSNLQEWEALFFSTGDICIRAINIPTSSYDGTNNIVASATYSYTKLTTSSRYVTFYTQDENNTTFRVDQNIIDLIVPYDRKYLVKASDKYYTITDGELVELEDITEVTAAIFREYGVDTIPESSLLITLTDPTILYWIDTNEHDIDLIRATETALPPAQTIESVDYDMTDSTILGVEKVTAVATSEVMFAVSVDSGTTWKMWTGTAWGTLSEEASGMSADVINDITTDNWNALMITGKFRFRITLTAKEDEFTSLIVDYVN